MDSPKQFLFEVLKRQNWSSSAYKVSAISIRISWEESTFLILWNIWSSFWLKIKTFWNYDKTDFGDFAEFKRPGPLREDLLGIKVIGESSGFSSSSAGFNGDDFIDPVLYALYDSHYCFVRAYTNFYSKSLT